VEPSTKNPCSRVGVSQYNLVRVFAPGGEWNGSSAGGGGLLWDGWVARCWALRNQAPGGWMASWGAGFLVVVWLLDSGREHLCSCLLRSIPGRCFLGGRGVRICFCCVVFVCVATSYEGRMVDALASRADEGRRSLR
jgi:hypothetical protein